MLCSYDLEDFRRLLLLLLLLLRARLSFVVATKSSDNPGFLKVGLRS